jgi:hypothetical protein
MNDQPLPAHAGFLGAFQPLLPPAAVALAQAGGAGAPVSVTGFAMQTQEQDQWCWAAVAVSIALKYDPAATWSQCSLASAFYGAQGQALDCCGADGDACDKPQALSQVFGVTHNLNGAAIQNPVPQATLDHEIRADRPVAIRIGWPPDNVQGHFIAVCGLSTGADGTIYVDVGDPSSDDDATDNLKHMSLSELTQNYGLVGGSWTWTYLTKA